MNINDLVLKHIETIDFEQIIKKQVQDSVTKCVKDAIENSLRSYSKFGKEVEKHIEEGLAFNAERIPLSAYSEFLTDQVAEILKDITSDERTARLKAKLRDKLGLLNKPSIEFNDLIKTLEKIVQEIFDDKRDEDPCGCENYKIRIICEKKSETYSDSWTIRVFEGETDHGQYSCQNLGELSIFKDGRAYHSSKLSNGDVFGKLFKAYAFNGTLINNIREYDETFDIGNYED